MKLNNKKVLVIGMGKSGYAVSKLIAQDNDVTITDKKEQDIEKLNELASLGIKFIQSDKQEDILDVSYDVVIRNPGVDPKNEVIQKAYKLGICVTNEIEIAYSYLPKNVKIIGITGSNGKTTTTTMIYELLKMMKKNVILGGNIGYPLSEIAPICHENDILVLEISDHQLYDTIDFKTDISVLLNLSHAHLDFHGTYENYKNVKMKIFNHHTKDDLAIINFANDDSLESTKNISSRKEFFNGNNAYIRFNSIFINTNRVLDLDQVLVKGSHNYDDIMACLLVAKEFGDFKDAAIKYFSNFKGVEHRLEFVCKKNNVSYYNDSKSTNCVSTIVALNAFDSNVHLILGGFEREQDFHELDGEIKRCKCIYAIGECEKRVKEYADSMNINCILCTTLKNAIDCISKNISEGDTVLLSPASASWDQYEKFEDRGNEFKDLVKSL